MDDGRTPESHRWWLTLHAVARDGFLASILIPAQLRDGSGLLRGAIESLAAVPFVHLAGLVDAGPDMLEAFASRCTITYMDAWYGNQRARP